MNAERLDAQLGDPYDELNPVGFAAVLAADERQEMLADGERLLDAYGLNEEFVPAADGGRLSRADRLADVLRAVWRRDPCLGLGYGLSSFIAAVTVWTGGNPPQRRAVADLLRGGGRVAAGFHELAHGNDFAQADCAAHRDGDGWRVSGRKEVIANLRRAEAVVLFARTSSAPGSRSHSLFLVPTDSLPAERVRHRPRVRSSGMRGVPLGAVEFDGCPVSGAALIGEPGHGIEIAMRSHQVTRAVAPAVYIGPLETALRVAVDCAERRRLYGRAAADLSYVRVTLARAYADLLAIDAVASVGVRALHLLPDAMAVYAPAVKYLTTRILLDAFDDLATVLGAQGYLREGRYAIFQKLLRDMAPATFAHLSRAGCLASILPQLPRLARRSWLADDPAPDAVYDLGADLPSLSFDDLRVGLPHRDRLVGALSECPQAGDDRVARFTVRCQDELRTLRDACAGLPPTELTIDASSATFALAHRYAVLLAGAVVPAVWRVGGDRFPAGALPGVLDRLAGRLGGDQVLTPAERDDADRQLFDLLMTRCGEDRPLALTAL